MSTVVAASLPDFPDYGWTEGQNMCMLKKISSVKINLHERVMNTLTLTALVIMHALS